MTDRPTDDAIQRYEATAAAAWTAYRAARRQAAIDYDAAWRDAHTDAERRAAERRYHAAHVAATTAAGLAFIAVVDALEADPDYTANHSPGGKP